MDQIRKNLEDALKTRGVSMAELSRKLQRNEAYVQQYLRGKQNSLPYEERLTIAGFLDMKPHLLGVAEPQQRARQIGQGLSEDAEAYVPPRGHYLSSAPAHYWMLTQKSGSLDQHSERIRKGDVLIFDLNKSNPAKIPALTIVAAQLCSRAELTESLGTATRLFVPPNKLITNSAEFNEIWSLEDDTLPFVPVIRGSFVSIIRELN